jgi:hypothetical protein
MRLLRWRNDCRIVKNDGISLTIIAIMEVPTRVADQNNQILCNAPDKSAGARGRAEFIGAPEMNGRKKMSRPTTPAFAKPLKPFGSFV